MTLLIGAAAHCMQEFPTQVRAKEYLMTKMLMSSPEWKYAHRCDVDHLSSIPKVEMDETLPLSTFYVPGILMLPYTVSTESIFIYLIVDILLYIGEALLQFIKAFYLNFCQSLSKMEPQWKETSRRIFSSLLVYIHMGSYLE